VLQQGRDQAFASPKGDAQPQPGGTLTPRRVGGEHPPGCSAQNR